MPTDVFLSFPNSTTHSSPTQTKKAIGWRVVPEGRESEIDPRGPDGLTRDYPSGFLFDAGGCVRLSLPEAPVLPE